MLPFYTVRPVVSSLALIAVASDAVAVGTVVSSDVAEKAVAAVNWC